MQKYARPMTGSDGHSNAFISANIFPLTRQFS